MPGEELEDALGAALDLDREGIGTILTKLGENLESLDEATAVRDHYLDASTRSAPGACPASCPSSRRSWGSTTRRRPAPITSSSWLTRADQTGSTLWIDMEDSSYVDRTLDLYRALKARHEQVGLALQAYLRRTPADLESLLPLRPIIRLVKGAYAEPEHVAFPDKRDTDLAFYQLADTLLHAAARSEAHPIFGTHDMLLVRRIVARAAELGVADGRYEIHMLYGVRMKEQRELARAGRTVATLISYGSAWFPWYMRRLAERPANIWFIVRSLFPS
jgi:proline dehydrogenase